MFLYDVIGITVSSEQYKFHSFLEIMLFHNAILYANHRRVRDNCKIKVFYVPEKQL